jgi:hypothetical protein
MAQGGGYQLSQALGSLQKCPFNTTLLEGYHGLYFVYLDILGRLWVLTLANRIIV